MDALGVCATKRWPNLLHLVESLPSASEAWPRPCAVGSRIHLLGASVGDYPTSIRYGLGPSVGDDTPPCDARLKDIISRVGSTVYGLPLYRFRYKGRTEVYEGVMAQDVLEVMPSAVSCGDDGTYRVNLRELGLELHRVS